MMGLFRAAMVIARRDFTAVIFSKAFFFFLLGPLFPIIIGVAAGGVGNQVARDMDQAAVAVIMPSADTEMLLAARKGLVARLGERSLPVLIAVDPDGNGGQDRAAIDRLLDRAQGGTAYAAALSGTLAAPVLTAPARELARWEGSFALLIQHANAGITTIPTTIRTHAIAASEGGRETGRLKTAQGAQMILFLLTMLLAGMVLSNLVEEKTNKIIEILAAALPIDAIFLGKLFAMLAMAFVGIGVWFGVGGGLLWALGGSIPSVPAPAIGWPLFLLLGVVYFSMAYLLLGSLFLGIGGMAATVREVQTLSMPVTMGQLMMFFFASYAVTKLGEPIELFTVAFPFSSPFAMLARAAQQDLLWPHLLACAWQLLWVAIIIRIGAGMFRRNVMKSGGGGRKRQRRSLFRRVFAARQQ